MEKQYWLQKHQLKPHIQTLSKQIQVGKEASSEGKFHRYKQFPSRRHGKQARRQEREFLPRSIRRAVSMDGAHTACRSRCLKVVAQRENGKSGRSGRQDTR